jgi:hypothetical protein
MFLSLFNPSIPEFSHVREHCSIQEKSKVSRMKEKKKKSRANRNKFMKILGRAAIWGLFFLKTLKKSMETHTKNV